MPGPTSPTDPPTKCRPALHPAALVDGRWNRHGGAESERCRRDAEEVIGMTDLQKRPPDEAAEQAATTEQGKRELALKRLKKRRDFAAHLLMYIMVNSFLVVIWAITGAGFFWPVFPIVGWGIGVVMNAWDVWRGDYFSEEAIAREMERLDRRE
jgi:hypothetical protein